MNKSIQISFASKGDIAGIDSLEKACFLGHSYPDFFFRQALDCWPDGLLVAKDAKGTVIGYLLATTSSQPHLLWLLSLAVGENQRGKGVGQQLIAQLLSQLPACVTQVNLTVAPDNRAKMLYLRSGFVELGYEDDYFGLGEPRLLLGYTR